jgi:hypothetical protein
MNRMGLTVLLVALLSWTIPGAGRAADDAHDQAARELLRAMRAEELTRGGRDAMVDVMVQTNPALAGYRDVISEWANKVLTWKAMEPGIIDAYKSVFTAAEMRKVAEFYRTPEGQKLLEKMPELMQKQAKVGTALAQAHQDELRAMIEARAKKQAGKGEKK